MRTNKYELSCIFKFNGKYIPVKLIDYEDTREHDGNIQEKVEGKEAIFKKALIEGLKEWTPEYEWAVKTFGKNNFEIVKPIFDFEHGTIFSECATSITNN